MSSQQLGTVVRPHQADESVFRAILSEDIEWKQFAAFPEQARLAVLIGEPAKAGPYVIRVKVPSGVKLMPHRHPEDRVYTCYLRGLLHRPWGSVGIVWSAV